MDTLIYSIGGIIALIAISAFFNYLSTRNHRKIARHFASIRKAAALSPDRLLFTPYKADAHLLPATDKARKWKLDGLGPFGANPVH